MTLRFVSFSSLLIVTLFAGSAFAVGTRTFSLDTQDKLSGGELEGTAIDSEGNVGAGWLTAKTSLSAESVWCALPEKAGNALFVGTGNVGKVVRIEPAGKETVYAETGALAVTALAYGAGGKLYAADIDGQIYQLDATKPSGSVKPWTSVSTEKEHIWALAFDEKRNDLFAATGPHGKIYRIDPTGRSQVFAELADTQVTALALSPKGVLYAGTSPKALVVAVPAVGKTEVVEDFDANQIQALAFGADSSSGETLYALVDQYSMLPLLPMPQVSVHRQPSPLPEPPRTYHGSGKLYRVSELAADGKNGKPEQIYANANAVLMSLVTVTKATDAVAFVGTGDGQVIRVGDAHQNAIVAKVDSHSVVGLGVSADGKGNWLTTSDAPAYYRVTSNGGPDALWTSKVLDAGIAAHFGQLSWRTENGDVELQARTGNTETPDNTWSDWSAALAKPAHVTSPAGRFVQVRARWKSPTAILRGVSLAFVTNNLRAMVTDVMIGNRSSIGTGIVSSGTEIPTHTMSERIRWTVDNPDSDSLRYRVWYQSEKDKTWRPLVREDEPISSTEFTWSTESLEDGWYRVRVEASDEAANPVGMALKHANESAPFLVDNTAPTLTGVTLSNDGKLRAECTDNLGPIARIDVQIDGRGPWQALVSTDGMLDEAKETIDTSLGIKGSHVIALRCFDAAGNLVTREATSK